MNPFDDYDPFENYQAPAVDPFVDPFTAPSVNPFDDKDDKDDKNEKDDDKYDDEDDDNKEEEIDIPQSAITNPNMIMEDQMPEGNPLYEQDYNMSMTSLGKSFFLKGRENTGRVWDLKNKLQMSYDSQSKLPMYHQMSLYDISHLYH